MKQRKWLFASVSLLVLALALPALAQRPRHGGLGPDGFPGPGPHGGGPGGVIAKLIFPCDAACFDTVRTCAETADAEAVSCLSAACSTEVTAAQNACSADRAAQACRTAARAVRDCGASCLDTLETAHDACHDALSTCREACDGTQN
jgi:hypothetical protein